jgi:large subunit ribosomal protein L22
MEIKATQKFVRISPKKLRFVADVARKMSPVDATEQLPFIGKRAADPIVRVIKTALANAKDKGIDATNLIFKELQINEGPRLKRGRPVSRGRWHPYKRRMSHIRVVLATQSDQISSSGSEKNSSKKLNETVKESKPGKAAPIKRAVKSVKQAVSKKGGISPKKSV